MARTTPLLGSKVWFGPRRFGWGWDPVAWQGWVALAVWMAVLLACGLLPKGTPQLAGIAAASFGLLLTLILKGTPPGGPEAADRFQMMRRYAARTPDDVEHDRRLRRDVPDEPSVTDAAARLKRFRRPGAS